MKDELIALFEKSRVVMTDIICELQMNMEFQDEAVAIKNKILELQEKCRTEQWENT